MGALEPFRETVRYAADLRQLVNWSDPDGPSGGSDRELVGRADRAVEFAAELVPAGGGNLVVRSPPPAAGAHHALDAVAPEPGEQIADEPFVLCVSPHSHRHPRYAPPTRASRIS